MYFSAIMCLKISFSLWIMFCLYGFLVALHCDDRIWIKQDNATDKCYYISNNKLDRSDADESCGRCGGSLAILNDKSIHNYLVGKTSTADHWIGLKLSDEYSWTSPLFHHEEIPSINGTDSVGLCVVSEDGTLKYKACDEHHMVVCERAKINNSCGDWDDVNGHCYRKKSSGATFMNAHIFCDHPIESYVTTLINFNHSSPYWFGVSRYSWDDKTPLYWQMWQGKILIGTQKCVTLSGSIWKNYNCTLEKNFICQRNCNFSTSNHQTTDNTATTTTRSTYKDTTTPDTTVYIQSTPSVTTLTEKPTTELEEETYSNISTMDFVTQSLIKKTVFTSTRPIDINSMPITERLQKKNGTPGPILIGSVTGATLLVIVVVVLVIIFCRRSTRKRTENHKGDYDASYEIAFSQNTEDKTRNSDSSLTDDEKLAQLRDRDSRVVIDSNVPDSEKIKPYLVTTIVDGHGEGQPSRRSKVVSSIEDRVEYDNNYLDELIVTDNDLYHSSGSDPNRSDGRPRSTDYDYAVRPPHPNQPSQGNVFINNAYDGEAAGGAVNDIQGAQIHYADIAFSTETLNKENTYADIDDFVPHHGESDANVPTTAGVAPSENKPSNANNETDSDNQVGKMKAIPVYAEVDANKMDKNKNEIIDDRKDAHDLEEGVNDLIVTDNDLYDFDN